MSGWRALNVESDNEEEDEIDDTKEIQIEEALKLYQTALRYHSEGPQAFTIAAEAYKALFESEIFQYTESLSEFKRHELHGDNLVFDTILQDDFNAGPVQVAGGNESAPNTLPQILHLSYKNHGQFVLEAMQQRVRQHGPLPWQQLPGHLIGALNHFAEALDKEDTDLDLWLRTASVAAMLCSSRITRFCLEAVLDGNDEQYEGLLALPGLEEDFATQQLHELLLKLDDKIALMQAPFAGRHQKKLSKRLQKQLNPVPSAPFPAEVVTIPDTQVKTKQPERFVLPLRKWDWASVGEAILHRFLAEQSGLAGTSLATSCVQIVEPQTRSLQEDIARESDPASTQSARDGSQQSLAQASGPIQPQEDEIVLNREDSGGVNIVTHQEETLSVRVKDNSEGVAAERVPSQSRKRSTDSAGLPETADGGRSRSKRLRAREACEAVNKPETTHHEAAKQMDNQLWNFTHADQCLCEVLNDIFMRLGIEGLGDPENLRNLMGAPSASDSSGDTIDKVACDMFAALQNSASNIAPTLLSAEPVDLRGASRDAGLNAFLGNANSNTSYSCTKPALEAQDLSKFADIINTRWLTIQETAFAWLEALLSPEMVTASGSMPTKRGSSYMCHKWAENLKRHVVQVAVNLDEYVVEVLLERIQSLNTNILQSQMAMKHHCLSVADRASIEMVETLFELHLDVYSLFKHPHSGVDTLMQESARDRLERWANLSRESMQLRSHCAPSSDLDELSLRHIWASVFHMSVNDDVLPEQTIYALEELTHLFRETDGPIIEVQNNAVMPELSAAAVDRELVRISMKDFFLKVFDTDEKDPVAIIESLEPILEPQIHLFDQTATEFNEHTRQAPTSTICSDLGSPSHLASEAPNSPTQEMRKYLNSASLQLRLSIWQRLREAYEAIEYPPKVLSCYLRSIEVLVGEFDSSAYRECTEPDRHIKLISRLRIVDEVVIKILLIIKDEQEPFACLSYSHVESSMTAVNRLLRVMFGVNNFLDLVRIGRLSTPRMEGLPAGTFANMTNKLLDLEMRLWMLQYHLLREGSMQNNSKFPNPSDDAFEYLRHVHHATGVRSFSHMAARLFLRLEKDELLRIQDITEVENRDNELSQVLYDLYGLKTFVNPLECQENGSIPDVLDKKTAHNLLTFIMLRAEKMDIKDITKHDLKVTIDRVHGALGRPKANEDISLNRKLLTTFFKSPINPVQLFKCVQGLGFLSTKHVPADSALPASKGWYFLMGNIALNKFRSQKRMAQGPTEDLNVAQAFFLQDLEFSIESWESWYRLAQANDTQLEEAVSWTADKMNSSSAELITSQRASIHCYTMATAFAERSTDTSAATLQKVASMYTDFGNRIYSSSREPFGMAAFSIKDAELRFCSGAVETPIYQSTPFSPLTAYQALKFSASLYRRAIRLDSSKWWNHYMLGKCLWKMYCVNVERGIDQSGGVLSGPNLAWEPVIDAITDAIEAVPEKKERSREPILEPHYKLISILHKLVQRKVIDHAQGQMCMKHSSFADNVSGPDSADDWERYVLSTLKVLRTADKASWHHRMVARAAHVIYDSSNDMLVAHAAKHELTQQIFTKTMAVQVWKPEFERPGRHFVYTTRYTRFFMQLLGKTGDRTSLEALAKRVRRKTTDFFEHGKLWQELCLCYVQLLRRIGEVPVSQEDTVFRNLNHDEYNIQAARMEYWSQKADTQHPLLDVLREVVDLKRLNNALTKAGPIDDLMGDTFAVLYTTIGPTLSPLPSETSAADPQADSIRDNNNRTPFTMFQSNQVMHQVEPVTKTRTKPVGRREIQRRAEACAQKPVGASGQVSNAIPIRSPPVSTHASFSLARASPEKKVSEPTITDATSEHHLNIPSTGIASTATGTISLEHSAPASIHDDADDESELSELDEEEVQEICGDPKQVESGLSAGSAPLLFAGGVASTAHVRRVVDEVEDAEEDTNVEESEDGERVDEMETA